MPPPPSPVSPYGPSDTSSFRRSILAMTTGSQPHGEVGYQASFVGETLDHNSAGQPRVTSAGGEDTDSLPALQQGVQDRWHSKTWRPRNVGPYQASHRTLVER